MFAEFLCRCFDFDFFVSFSLFSRRWSWSEDALTACTSLGVTLCSIGSGSFAISVTYWCAEGGTIEI